MRPYLKTSPSKKGAGEVAQGVGLEFKLQYHKKERKKKQKRAHCSGPEAQWEAEFWRFLF
jgi:hypothetical protein